MTDNIIAEIRSLLAYHQGIGIDSYPVSKEIDALLHYRPGIENPPGKARPAVQTADMVPRRAVPVKSLETDIEPVQVGSLADIREEVAECTRCTLAQKRVVPVAGEGAAGAKLLIVGDWMSVPAGSRVPAGCLFGIEQDRMLARMLEAIRLQKKEVFITNIIKCGVADTCQPKAEHVQACSFYLQRQISAIRPQLILAMGRVAARTLLNRRESLTRLRGRVLSCPGPGDEQIPLIATYHPTFLLQNPEMKKATWQDLQLLAGQLGIVLG